jgi:hypothetical protein
MKLICPLLLLFSMAANLTAGALDDAARKVLLDHLRQSSSEFLDSVKALTPEQWNYKTSAERWSVAECAEHIALSEDFIRDIVENKILAAASTPERVGERKTIDAKVLAMVTDRSFKAKAPEPLAPSRKFATPEAALQHFQESRAKTTALAKSRDDLRERAGPHPVFKELDAYQWLLFLSGHTLRHTAQIREVKADAGFPASR